ncbi:hypothetical protein [Flavonifractor sp. An4]|uniref:hypothetical protein n=1 Tax=Flavonifractor sp. An4 TaxID=1965634 RepID=UPI000B393FF9|nr:hypothetical protein [Flavonifractor sp. An4]OUO08037.1 hypothetical protein B5F94_15585 [Flavonifractor sp. An4]
MSIQTEITRIENARNTMRNKAVELGIAEGTAKMDVLAAAFDGIVNQGAVSATVTEGDTYTIPKGYHNGSGTVSGTAGGGNYKLQSKQVTPTKQQQNVTPDGGFYGLSDVTVAAIPAQYQDVSSVTAIAADVLANKNFVTKDGQLTAGTMPNIGAVSETLNTTTKFYTVPKGYHSGTGTVSIVTEEKTATPTKAPQDITPTTGKVLSKVTVEAIPAEFVDTSDATAAAGEILDGKTAYIGGLKVEGTMANNGAVAKTLDSTTTSFTIPAGYHDGKGTVGIDVETKTATPTESQQTVAPTAGKVLTAVTVEAIPARYKDTTPVTAAAADVLDGKFIVTGTGAVEGTMPNNGAVNKTIDGLTETSAAIPAGYTTGGTVSLDSSIEDALASI